VPAENVSVQICTDTLSIKRQNRLRTVNGIVKRSDIGQSISSDVGDKHNVIVPQRFNRNDRTDPRRNKHAEQTNVRATIQNHVGSFKIQLAVATIVKDFVASMEQIGVMTYIYGNTWQRNNQ